ncbi:MAG: hypothetical protein AAF727_06145 [Pseudomonadota bacterium]
MSALRPLQIATLMLSVMARREIASVVDLASETGSSTESVGKASQHLLAKKYIERTRPGCFRITPAGQRAAAQGEVITKPRQRSKPKSDTVTSRAWRAIRIRRTFTVNDLVRDVQRAGDGDAKSAIQHYCTALARAGFLQGEYVCGAPQGRGVGKCYRLSRDTGVVAPRHIQKDGVVHDFNTGEDVPCAT